MDIRECHERHGGVLAGAAVTIIRLGRRPYSIVLGGSEEELEGQEDSRIFAAVSRLSWKDVKSTDISCLYQTYGLREKADIRGRFEERVMSNRGL